MNKNKCENPKCHVLHDGSYGSGRFCSDRCAKGFSTSKARTAINEKVSNSLFGKRYAVHHKNIDEINSILQISSRTVAKILKRAGVGCVLCGWNLASLDLHHVIPVAKGGSDEHQNLVIVCPNCHRMAHEEIYSQDELLSKTLDKTFPDWKKYYNPCPNTGKLRER